MEDENSIFKVRTSEELGRYLVAARDLSSGEVVITERPIVFAPKSMPDPEATMPCVGCYKPVFIDVGERCPRCGWPVCSGHCPGLKDSRNHGVECAILSLRPDCALDDMAEYYRHDALLPLRCLLLQKSDPLLWKQFLEMQSHMECRTPGTQSFDEAEDFIVEYLTENFLSKLDSDMKKALPDTSKDILHRICGIIDTNALEIRLPDGVELQALYTKTCILEHSCLPNTKFTFDLSTKNKNDLYKITVKIVTPVNEGENLSTMYSHALWGTQARRQHLKDTKYFSCKCRRCSDPTELGTYLSAMKCLGDGTSPCEGIHLPEDPLDEETEWACSKCSVKISNSQVCGIISQMQDEVDSVLLMGGAVTVLENLLGRLSTFLHPNHYLLYSIKHSLIQLYGRQPGYSSQEFLDKKIKMCRDLIKVTNTLDPGNARLSLYNSVLHHELHLALVIKTKKANADDSMKNIDIIIKPMLNEANDAVKIALNCLKDDIEEASGKKLYDVIELSKKEFEKFCKGKNIVL